jgi:predicted NAD-dependent protein-ADP-ribosyltransferase YbiA (DUF1768 family)
VAHLAGLSATSVEHVFQAARTLDPREAQRVLQAPTSGATKRLGRTVLLRSDWEVVKYQAMMAILRSKFSDPDLRARGWRLSQPSPDGR